MYTDKKNKYKSIELFAGCGGLALGSEMANFEPLLLNEFDKNACATLRHNRPLWNVICEDIKKINFSEFNNKVDLITGGFPCQAFSHSGKRLGFEDTRGTLFYEYARAIDEIQPKCFLAENVKGLISHDGGRTLDTIVNVFSELGYHIYKPFVVNANDYETAQKRERVIIIGVKQSISNQFKFEIPKKHIPLKLRDVLFKGNYYDCDVNDIKSIGSLYSERKAELFSKISQGGNWKSLTKDEQMNYMGKMFFSGGGKTGILKRLSYDEPSVTLLTSPSQKQTERCHPIQDRPLNIREYARIQGFPDSWEFKGSVASQYKQIGNAVPVLLAYHLCKEIFNQLENIDD